MKHFFAIMLMTLSVIANAFTGKVQIDGIYYNLVTKANVAEVTFGDTPYSDEYIYIPATIDYEGTTCYITSIGDKAFKNCANLRNVSLPDGIKTIGSMAFQGCKLLQDMHVPDSVTTINGYAFEGCSGLKTISFPAALTNMYDAFSQNTNLESVYITDLASWCRLSFYQKRSNPLSYAKHLYVNGEELTDLIIPEGLTKIGDSFWGFNSLKTLIIPEGVTEIGACAFGDCDNLTSVSIANTVKKIDYYAFRNCDSLREIYIPSSVSYIGEQDFAYCKELKKVIIGTGLNYLGSAAFSGCTELTDVFVYTNSVPETFYENAFSNSDINYATLHVRESLIPSFRRYVPWKNFGAVVKVPEITYTVDGEIYEKDVVIIGTPISAIDEPIKEGYTFSGWSEIPDVMPNEEVVVTGTFSINTYKLRYCVDGLLYKEYDVTYGTAITPESAPTKEGYTFSGWSNIPTVMPAHDVEVNGHFSVNRYLLTYKVDGEIYKQERIAYADSILAEENPSREGHTFSGWSEIPATMPAHDVEVNGSFTVNKYLLTYKVDGEVYKTDSVEYGTEIVPEAEPSKEGHTFSGWSEIPATMPAHDVEVNGSFAINTYQLTYIVDGDVYKTDSIIYGSEIVPLEDLTKEGYTFSGWSEIPATMPAHDVEVTGSFAVNYYLLTYIVDGEVYKTDSIAFGTEIVPLEDLTKEGYTFSGWSEIPAVMPAYDVEVTGSFSVNYYQLTYFVDGEVYKTDSIAFGTEIVPAAELIKEGHTFSGWSEIPAVMPAYDVEVTGSFSANTYYIIYKVEGEEYFVDSVKYGEQIVPVEEPEREGYTFSGWQGLPEDLMMPAHDVEVTGTFAVNYYLLTYLVDGEVYQQDSVAYGTEIVLMPNPEKPGYIFSGWSGYPEDLLMPAADVTIVGSFEVDGIQRVAAGAGADTVYDLLGRKVQTQRKGEIYLQNGKKIMIR